jgi:putative ABC transport system ATP-binding protein
MGSLIKLAGVSKAYRGSQGEIVALSRINLDVAAASIVAVTGPSGSGKSTLLHVIGAMDAPDSGRIEVDAVDVTRLTPRQQADYRRQIGFVFQRFHLLPALTALDNVLAPVLPYRTAFDKAARATHLLAALGLAGREAALPSKLSGGEQQRVAIARALINDPSLVLADEPTGNLDSHTSSDIMQVLLDLRQDRGLTIIVATHDPVIASRCDRVIRLQDGQVVEDLRVTHDVDPDELLRRIGRLGLET